MPAIALTSEEHVFFDAALRGELPYVVKRYSQATLRAACKKVYKRYPELRKIALDHLKHPK
jgi:hypothetical protein